MATTERGTQFMDGLKRLHTDAERMAIQMAEERDQIEAENTRLRSANQDQADELIALRERVGLIEQELSIERSDHGITRRELAEQTAALTHLEQQAHALSHTASAAKNLGNVKLPARSEMDPVIEDIGRLIEAEGFHRKPALVAELDHHRV